MIMMLCDANDDRCWFMLCACMIALCCISHYYYIYLDFMLFAIGSEFCLTPLHPTFQMFHHRSEHFPVRLLFFLCWVCWCFPSDCYRDDLKINVLIWIIFFLLVLSSTFIYIYVYIYSWMLDINVDIKYRS